MTFGPSLGFSGFTFYEGTFSSESLTPAAVMLDGIEYAINVPDYRRRSQTTLRDGVVQSAEPSDVLFNANGAWARYRDSWWHGADQEAADRAGEADPARFHVSRGVDPWTDHQLTLHHAVTEAQAATSTNPLLCVVDDSLYVADGANLYVTTDLATFTSCTAPGGTIQSLSADGVDLYVATSTVCKKYVAGATTPTAFSTPITGNCTRVAFVANRLLLAKGNVLYEVAGDGTLTTIKTHFQSTFVWTAIFNVGSRIYIGGYAGNRSELYAVATDDTGVLVQSTEAAPLPPNELLYGAHAYAGLVLLLTAKGVRLAQVGGDATLTYGPLIEDVGACRAAVADGRFAWVGWTNFPDAGAGLARLALDVSVDVLQPAYASDLFTVNEGTVTSVARFLDLTVFAVAEQGVYVEDTTTYVADGYLESGSISFGTIERKGLVELEVGTLALPAATSVRAEITDDEGTEVEAGTYSLDGGRLFTLDLSGHEAYQCNLRLELSTTDTSVTPTVQRWRMRAYPIVPPVCEWLLPVLAYRSVTVNADQGEEMSQDVDALRTRLHELWASKSAVIYKEGENSYRVRVDAYEFIAHDWSDDGQTMTGIMVLQLVEA